MNLGVDFGSTYSSFSFYDEIEKKIELCKPGEKDPEAIPSVACIDDDGNLLTGYSAKAHIQLEDPEALSFSAFKMLLNEQDQRILSSRNYSAEYTPKRVAGAFLQQQIHRILSNHAASEIENLVICAPEVWTTQNAVRHGQMDGRTILRDICDSIPEVRNVNVVSEPAAASAYFAYRYRETAPQSYRLLIIDYGGGTLDLTLTEVHSQGASVEIKVLYRTGFGENENGKIGNAGIAYMERVMQLAIAEATGGDADAIPKNASFRKAVSSLENKLMDQVSLDAGGENGKDSSSDNQKRLWYAVEECGAELTDLLDNTEQFAKIRYGRKPVIVTFAHLMQAYNEIIAPTLEKCMKEVTAWTKKHNKPDFYVVLAGGFGKFILVQKQVEWYFERSRTGDRRFQYSLGKDREYAVSMGAALLASGIMTIKRTAPYGIGIYTETDKRFHYAINFRQELIPKHEYWICGQSGASGSAGTPTSFVNGASAITHLSIGTDEDAHAGTILPLTPTMQDKIIKAYQDMTDEYQRQFPNKYSKPLHHIGFTMDESEIVSMLVQYYEPTTRSVGHTIPIELSDYNKMFGLTEAKFVTESGT
ncbi:MAG: hypothetical protein LUC48_09490 [Clostridiales bacterium]|nr:hypothetical protein [Clostridiales bacterium]